MRFKTLINVATFCFLISAALLSAGTGSKEFEHEYEFTQNGHIKIDNINGTIYVESWDEESVEVFADIEVKSRNSRDLEKILDKIDIFVKKKGDKLFIHSNYSKSPGNSGFFDWIFGSHKNKVNIEYWIKVPYKSNLECMTVNGNIEVINIEGEADLQTTNGKIILEEIIGPIEAKTTNGGVVFEMSESRFAHNVSLRTTNGSIKLYLPDDINADIDATTVNGGIRTDFPLEINGTWNSKNVQGQIRGGGNTISLSTVNGSVSLYER